MNIRKIMPAMLAVSLASTAYTLALNAENDGLRTPSGDTPLKSANVEHPIAHKNARLMDALDLSEEATLNQYSEILDVTRRVEDWDKGWTPGKGTLDKLANDPYMKIVLNDPEVNIAIAHFNRSNKAWFSMTRKAKEKHCRREEKALAAITKCVNQKLPGLLANTRERFVSAIFTVGKATIKKAPKRGLQHYLQAQNEKLEKENADLKQKNAQEASF